MYAFSNVTSIMKKKTELKGIKDKPRTICGHFNIYSYSIWKKNKYSQKRKKNQ